MAFTEKKFASLSRLNKFKKTVVAIKQYLEERKEAAYVLDLLNWLEKYEHYSAGYPAGFSQIKADYAEKNDPAGFSQIKADYAEKNDPAGFSQIKADYAEKKDSAVVSQIDAENTGLKGLTDYDWGMIIQKLLIEIGNQSTFTEDKPFDDTSEARKLFNLKIVLDNIRSPFNVGSIIRSSESFGVNEVFLTGFTPGPSANNKVNRTAMNARLEIKEEKSCLETIKQLKEQGYQIAALEKSKNSRELHPLTDTGIVLVVGNEEFGISEEVLSCCDGIYHIPMFGAKNSINVSVAAGIALYEISKNLTPVR